LTDAGSSPRHLAELLLSIEAKGAPYPLRAEDAFERACSKLTARLARVIGDRGARTVLLRAVAITRTRFPFLDADPALGAGDCLKAPAGSLGGQDPAVEEALTSLLANVIGVIVDLLGLNLVYRLLSDAWPELEFPKR